MLAYRHQFHAGNFADVFKHALLARLLVALAKKAKPFCYLDTHAGIGRYDLAHRWAQKNREHEGGIGRLWTRGDAPALLAPYLDAVRAENPDGVLAIYPGSPAIAQRLLRPDDRMVLCELNEKDKDALRRAFARDPRAGVHRTDGFQAVKAFLPPRERRGLMLMDPSFDRKGEYARVSAALREAHRRFAGGVFAFWYPLMEPAALRALERDLRDSSVPEILQLELWVHPADWRTSLRGCGMLVVNPPYGFEGEARALLPWLVEALSGSGAGGQRVRVIG
ncbi:MAG: 23S rRNA (adenine(2030)-N(6))-methyltransferase RlmJ [Burkholderiales bacterium]|nr:23S rRNA (adenine(2030)-N(6))-methyltransferase RlmJ [Burkholderiales bacterium]